MTAPVLISHEQTAKRWGVSIFMGITSTVVALMVIFHLFIRLGFPDTRETDPISFYGAQVLILGLGTFIIAIWAIPNMLNKGTFRFTLTQDRIKCSSPAESFGESYSIPISEITSLEEQESGDSRSWYFGTADGRRIWITTNYDNPALDIIRTLEELRPDLELTRVSWAGKRRS